MIRFYDIFFLISELIFCFLRSKDIEASSGNGDMAFQEVRKQQSVIEFILNHTEQIFSGASAPIKPKEGEFTLQCAPMRLEKSVIDGLYFYRTKFDVWGEVCNTPHQWTGWADETDEPGGGPGPLLKPKPPPA